MMGTGRATAIEGDRRTGPSAIPAVAILALGCAALLLRLRVLTLDGDARVVLLAVIYAGLFASSVLVPVEGGPRATGRRQIVVLLAGLAGAGGAMLAGGHPVPVPFGAWALPLSLAAAVAEEAFFRRACYGLMERRAGATAAVLVTAVAFAAIHIPFYGVSALPVDLGAGLLLGWQRWETGTWTVPAATHVAANLMAVMAR